MDKRRTDATDRLVHEWAKMIPEIDPRVERVVDRLLLSARYLERLAGQLSATQDLQYTDYEILARLFWTGPPHRLRPRQLAAGTMAPPTSVTSRLDRLQRRGLVRRPLDPADRRGLTVELTDEGRDVFLGIVKLQAQEERAIFEQLEPDELAELGVLLRQVMNLLEDKLGPAPRRTRLALTAE